MESFSKVISDQKPLTIFGKHSILDVQQGSEYAFGHTQTKNVVCYVSESS